MGLDDRKIDFSIIVIKAYRLTRLRSNDTYALIFMSWVTGVNMLLQCIMQKWGPAKRRLA